MLYVIAFGYKSALIFQRLFFIGSNRYYRYYLLTNHITDLCVVIRYDTYGINSAGAVLTLIEIYQNGSLCS